jgi:hypothetical protein
MYLYDALYLSHHGDVCRLLLIDRGSLVFFRCLALASLTGGDRSIGIVRSRYHLDRKLGGPQSRSGRRGEEKILDPTGSQTTTPRSSNPLYRLRYPGSKKLQIGGWRE